jgi:Sulfotransferase domain
MLGQVPGFCAVGELAYVWIRGVVEDELCGCGERFRSCPFWQQVGEEAFGGWDAVDGGEMVTLRAAVDRTRFIPVMLAPSTVPGYRARLTRYAELLGRLYDAIVRVSGASVVVDSTKHASTAFLLRRVPRLDLRVVHLVRDGRGVAYSWMKEVRKPEALDREAYLDRYPPARMGARWVTYNSLVHLLRSDRDIPSLLVRYEDLVREPRRSIHRIVSLAGGSVRDEDLRFIADGSVETPIEHNIAGNPVRFLRGRMPLRVDDEWRRKMATRDRRLVSAIGFPLLARYGYLPERSSP